MLSLGDAKILGRRSVYALWSDKGMMMLLSTMLHGLFYLLQTTGLTDMIRVRSRIHVQNPCLKTLVQFRLLAHLASIVFVGKETHIC